MGVAHKRARTHTHTYAHIRTHTHTFVHTHTRTFAHTHTRTHTHTYTHTRVPSCAAAFGLTGSLMPAVETRPKLWRLWPLPSASFVQSTSDSLLRPAMLY